VRVHDRDDRHGLFGLRYGNGRLLDQRRRDRARPQQGAPNREHGGRILPWLAVVGLWKSGTNTGLFLQSSATPSWSGAFVFNGTAAALTAKVGDVVDIGGAYSNFDGVFEIAKATSFPLTVTATGATATPTATLVTLPQVWTGARSSRSSSARWSRSTT
jgi:hypothetical protein